MDQAFGSPQAPRFGKHPQSCPSMTAKRLVLFLAPPLFLCDALQFRANAGVVSKHLPTLAGPEEAEVDIGPGRQPVTDDPPEAPLASPIEQPARAAGWFAPLGAAPETELEQAGAAGRLSPTAIELLSTRGNDGGERLWEALCSSAGGALLISSGLTARSLGRRWERHVDGAMERRNGSLSRAARILRRLRF